MARALTVNDVLNKKFKKLDFDGKWKDACGCPQRGGQTWFIQGGSKMGKTTFAMMFGKMLTQYGKVIYDSIEEGFCDSVKTAYRRVKMREVNGKFLLLDREEIPDLITRLNKRNPPSFVFIDSVQFAEMTFSQYKQLKWSFPDITFIYISHVKGNLPDGSVALRIYRDAALSWLVQGFKSFPTSRYSDDTTTGAPIIINQDLADKYWGLKNID